MYKSIILPHSFEDAPKDMSKLETYIKYTYIYGVTIDYVYMYV